MVGSAQKQREKGMRETNLKRSLAELIKQYNALKENLASEAQNIVKLKKLFYLQKISNLLSEAQSESESLSLSLLKEFYNIKFAEDEVKIMDKTKIVTKHDLETYLQNFGIHRDSSAVLQTLEFANAVTSRTILKPNFPKNLTFYECVRERNKILSEELTPENLEKFIEINQALMYLYNKDMQLRKRVDYNADILNLSYAKIEAVQNLINSKQKFKYYITEVLGNPLGNNRNFTFELDPATKPIVIRVENRQTLGAEAFLHTHEVSEYFTEDYASFMMPVIIDNVEVLRPIVFSEKVEGGDVHSYAENLSKEDEKVLVKETLHYFSQSSDFCVKLMAAGYYHPDIKLTNFLTSDRQIRIADRKTLLSTIHPNVADIETTPPYAPPEYKFCESYDEDGEFTINLNRAKRIRLDMPQFMSYQLGIALKQFILLGQGLIKGNKDIPPSPLTSLVANPSKELQNLSLLVEELTRHRASDRLTIEQFQKLLPKIHLAPQSFLGELEKIKPAASLSTYPKIQEFKLKPLDHRASFLQDNEDTFLEPRISVLPYKEVKSYLAKADKALKKIIYEEASNLDKFLNFISFGLYRLAPSHTLYLGKIFPEMDKTTRDYFSIFAKAESLGYLPSNDKSDLIVKILTVEKLIETDPKKRGPKPLNIAQAKLAPIIEGEDIQEKLEQKEAETPNVSTIQRRSTVNVSTTQRRSTVNVSTTQFSITTKETSQKKHQKKLSDGGYSIFAVNIDKTDQKPKEETAFSEAKQEDNRAEIVARGDRAEKEETDSLKPKK